MDAQTWERVQDLFAKAADLPAEERKAFLDRETATDATLRTEVEGLLLHDQQSQQRIQDAIGEVVEALPASEPEVDDWTGRTVGAYRIVREIGQGGMGSVFEAIRDDDEFRKRVAVKVATRAPFSADFRRRFRHERQILAQLEHPNIARLIDGGTTHGGLPYFAMEYIEGQTIVDFANARKLSLQARIHLFLDVCSAVDYAHQNFVVHRDLKPANILVDTSGTAKLLDFGIAKLLADDLAGGGITRTATASQLLTPDYCSPEQVRNDRITTRTDVYQLGLVLFELLTGQRGQKVDTKSPGAMEKAICEIELPRASAKAVDPARARELAGDLDNIIAMATNKDPERRYPAVAALAEDLRRQSNGLPVQARAGSFGYRAGKFLGRNKGAAAAAVLLLAAVTAGVVATAHQARRAERRFAQVRSLANTFVFDIHDQIAAIPGSTAARKTLVATALRYLENLREEAAGDPLLTLELANAYIRIGDVTGGSIATSHLGDSKGAMAAYEHADSLIRTLGADRDERTVLTRANVAERLGLMARQEGNVEKALHAFEQGAAAVADGKTPELVGVSGRLQAELSRLYASTGRLVQAQDSALRAMEAAKAVSALQPQALEPRNMVAVAQAMLAGVQLRQQKLEEAAASFRQSVAIREEVARAAPDNLGHQRDLMIGYGQLGDVLGFRLGANLGDAKGAAEAFAKASAIAENLGKRDPNDRRARADIAQVRLRLSAMLLDVPGQLAEADAAISSAIQYIGDLLRDDPNNYRMRYNRVYLLLRSGRASSALGRANDAIKAYETAYHESQALLEGPDGMGARYLMVSAAIQLARVRGVTAIAAAEHAAKEIETNPKLLVDPWTAAAAYTDLGRAFQRCGRPAQAKAWLEKGVSTWMAIKAVPQLESKRKAELQAAQQDLELCRKSQ